MSKYDFMVMLALGTMFATGLVVGINASDCDRPHADESHDTEHCVSPAPYIGVEDGVVVPRLSIPARRVR